MNSSAEAPQVQPEGAPPLKLMAQITAYRTSQCIRALVELGIPALLAQDAWSVEDLAAKTGSRAALLDRLLTHLVNMDVIGKDDQERYVGLPVTRYLMPGHQKSLSNWIACELDPLLWRSWERLTDQLRSGTTAFDLAHGSAFFEWHARDSAAQKRFDDQMHEASQGIGAVVVRSMHFEPGTKITDVGGGNGSFLAQTLEKNPGTEGTLFELPRAVESYDPLFENMRHEKRATVVTGSFFESVPGGAEVYLFSRVFHDFNDHAATTILQNTRRALTGGERLFLIEIMTDAVEIGAWGSSQDMFMLTQLGGRERSAEEFSQLLAQTGFETLSVTPTASPVRILEFRAAD
ncbi:methyltransferase [Roseibium sp. AS2]|uniref:methyltransferase n=1 Tax=Roseibium sp. AS2 TaxID=3135781 RepID=UPI003178C889